MSHDYIPAGGQALPSDAHRALLSATNLARVPDLLEHYVKLGHELLELVDLPP